MNVSRYVASADDGKEILRILESSSAKGIIELLYTRRPDAYESYMKDFGESRVFVSKKEGRTVGCCAELVREVYLGGERARSAYVCGLKKDADYDGSVGFGAGFIRSLQRDDIDHYYCSVISDNKYAQMIFERSKRIISIKPFAEYRTYIINPGLRFKHRPCALSFRRANESDVPALLEFLNEEGKKKDLFPVISSFDDFHALKYSDFYLLTEGSHIVAAASLWVQTDYKQYVVKKYRGIMKLARIVNPLMRALGYIRLPKENDPLRFPMLSFFLCRNDDPEYYRVFFGEIKKEVQKEHEMLVIGLPRNHFASLMLDKLPSVHFDTRLYEISFPWSDRKLRKANPDNIYPECGLL